MSIRDDRVNPTSGLWYVSSLRNGRIGAMQTPARQQPRNALRPLRGIQTDPFPATTCGLLPLPTLCSQ
jgi:hypothetical protein